MTLDERSKAGMTLEPLAVHSEAGEFLVELLLIILGARRHYSKNLKWICIARLKVNHPSSQIRIRREADLYRSTFRLPTVVRLNKVDQPSPSPRVGFFRSLVLDRLFVFQPHLSAAAVVRPLFSAFL